MSPGGRMSSGRRMSPVSRVSPSPRIRNSPERSKYPERTKSQRRRTSRSPVAIYQRLTSPQRMPGINSQFSKSSSSNIQSNKQRDLSPKRSPSRKVPPKRQIETSNEKSLSSKGIKRPPSIERIRCRSKSPIRKSIKEERPYKKLKCSEDDKERLRKLERELELTKKRLVESENKKKDEKASICFNNPKH